jgi:alpha-tubulin suppressor-like RCC1 family protein
MKWLDRFTSKTTAMALAFVMVLSITVTGIMFGFHQASAESPGVITEPIPHTARYKMVAGGGQVDYSLGIRIDGSLWSWGDNWRGQLGIGTGEGISFLSDFGQLRFYDQPSPVRVGTDNDWTYVSAGDAHVLGLREDGSLWSWGDNRHGQLGLGDQTLWSENADRFVPTRVGTDNDWAQIAAGQNLAVSVGIRIDGTLWTWGDNRRGQLGLGYASDDSIIVPTQVGTDTDWKEIFAGGNHTLAIRDDGSLWTWGENGSGELGLGDSGINSFRAVPTQVGMHTDWTYIAAGLFSSAGIREDGTLWAWGTNRDGNLGQGFFTPESSPVDTPIQVGNFTDWTSVAVGDGHALGTRADGSLWSWGSNKWQLGALGLGEIGEGIAIAPAQIGAYTDWAFVSVGWYHSLALRADGSLSVWGANWSGQLGIGTTTNELSPFGPPCTDCGYFYDENCICSCNHSMPSTWTPTTPATCTSSGIESRTCTNSGCDHTETQVIPATGHNHQWTTTTQPTCTANAILSYKCTICDHINGTSSGASPIGHNWTQWQDVFGPSCTNKGLEERHCLECLEEETRETSNTPCGSSCDECDPPCIDCDWENWVIDIDPTCTMQGFETRNCKDCDNFETNTIDTIPHTHAWTQTTAPTCTTAGIEVDKCACGHIADTRTGDPATGHNLTEWETTTPPTCTAQGLEERHCETCDHPETNILAPDPRSPEDPCENLTCPECKILLQDGDPDTNPSPNPNTGIDLSIPIIITSLVALTALTLQLIIFGMRRKKQREAGKVKTSA